MSWQAISSANHKARKPYGCVWCGERIEAGEMYHRYTGSFDGEFQSNPCHLECKDAMDKSDQQYLMDGFSEVNERGKPVPPYVDPFFPNAKRSER